MKILLLIIIFFVNFYSSQALETKIIHKIENEIITNIDIKKEFKYLLALNNQLKELDKESIFNISNESIIREKVKKIEILKNYKEIEISEEYANIIIKSLYSRLNIKSQREFEIYLKDYNITLDEIRHKITIDALWNQLIISKYDNQIKIDKKKIKKKLINKDKKQSKEYQLSEIIYEIKDKLEIKKKYEEINQSIEEVGFTNTASIYSISDTSKIGGDIGWVAQNSLSKIIKKTISTLKVGEISKPIILPNGILILKITNIRDNEIKIDYESLLKNAINYERNRQLNQYSKIYFNKIKKNLEFNE